LGDEPAYAGLGRGGQQRVGALGPEPVGGGEAAVQVPGEAHIRQGGRLVDDRLGPGPQDGLARGAGVEQVERDGLGAERPHPLGVSCRPEGSDNLMTLTDELRNEPGADSTARPHDQNSHRVLPFVLFSLRATCHASWSSEVDRLVTSPGHRGSSETTRHDGGM
jgi:hypothetical protein